jgi:hypothetical protein
LSARVELRSRRSVTVAEEDGGPAASVDRSQMKMNATAAIAVNAKVKRGTLLLRRITGGAGGNGGSGLAVNGAEAGCEHCRSYAAREEESLSTS